MMLKSKLKTLINEFTVCEYQATDQPCDITADGNNNSDKFISTIP